jgi:hypothetical protein
VESGGDIYCLRPAANGFTDSIPYLHENCHLHPDCHQDEDSHVNAAADLDQVSHNHSAAYAGFHFNPGKTSDLDSIIDTYRNTDTHPITDADAMNFITKGEK